METVLGEQDLVMPLPNSKASPPLVAVWMVTYNHESFISQAVESVLNQQTNFSFHLFIGDDFSTDSTRNICMSLAEKYPGQISLLTGDRNIGPNKNALRVYQACISSGAQYIALLEGDDYWSSPYKLQKQVDYLEKNKDCVSCHHWQEYAVKDGSGRFSVVPAPKEGQGYSTREKNSVADIFANEVRIKTRTHMFRNVIREIPEWYSKIAFGDVAMSMILGKHGKFGFIDEAMAVYRQTSSGISTAGIRNPLFTFDHFIKWIQLWEYGLKYYNFAYLKEGERTIIYFYSTIFNKYGFHPRIYLRSVFYCLIRSRLPVKYRLRIFAKVIGQCSKHVLKRIAGK